MDNAPKELTAEEKLKLYETALQAMAIPELRSKIVGVVDSKNNRSYYNEKVANELKFIVDEMIEDRIQHNSFTHREFPYQDFQENNGWSENTLFSYVAHGIAWLADHHPDSKYKQFKEETKITRRKGDTGVRILWKDHVIAGGRPGGMFSFVRKVVEEKAVGDWKELLLAWMQDPNGGKVFKAEQLSLKQEDKDFIIQMLEGNEGTFEIVKLDSGEIKIGRK